MANDMGSGAAAVPDPFHLRGLLVVLLGLGLGACASAPSARGPSPGAEEEGRPEAATAGEDAAAARVLERVADLRSTRPDRAALLADSAYFRWRNAPGRRLQALQALLLEARALESAGEPVEAADRVEELLEAGPPGEMAADAAERSARLHIGLGREPTAARTLLAHGSGLDRARRLELLEEAASGMSAAELEEVLAEGTGDGSPESTLLRAELARALWLTGRREAAREVVRSASLEGAPPAIAERVRGLREGRLEEAGDPPVRVEAVLPLSGSLAPVGRFLRQGMELALEEYRRGAGDSVVVAFRDDRSRPERGRALVRSAEEEGAVAVVGPARSAAFAGVLAARRDLALPVVSPTAASPPREGWNGYSLWGLESRERTLATEVGGWMAARAGIRRLAVLRPRGLAGRMAEQAFRAGAGRGGGGVLASTAYVPDSTTFEGQVRQLAGSGPDGVFVASRDPRTTLQIAPQLSYYGLGTAAVAGGSAWAQPAVVRRLRGGSPSLYVTAAFTDRGPGTEWSDFKAMYEMKYDKQLTDNMLPALGYDAMKAVLAAVDSVGLPRRGAVGRSLAEGPVDGATGTLWFRPGRPSVGREARVLLGVDGRLRAADPGELAEWVRTVEERHEARERRRRERAVERVQRWSGSGGGGP